MRTSIEYVGFHPKMKNDLIINYKLLIKNPISFNKEIKKT